MVKKSAVGIIFPNMHDSNIRELTNLRTMGSVPFGGRYRLIDFYLSSMANAGVFKIGAVVKHNYQSLLDHVGTGREWDLSRKRGGLTVFPPYGETLGLIYRGRIEALYTVLDYLKFTKEELVVLTDCWCVCNPDISDIVNTHIESGADLTIVYKKLCVPDKHEQDILTLTVDDGGRVTALSTDAPGGEPHNLCLNIFVCERVKLISLIADAIAARKYSFEQHVLGENLEKLKIMGYEHKGYAGVIFDMESYLAASMSLLDVNVVKELFGGPQPIYTKVRDTAPTRYNVGSSVKNSLIADGCVIEGIVENSILFRGVNVGKGAVVRNSVVMQGGYIENGAQLTYVITDKNVRISEGKQLAGLPGYPVYIAKDAMV